MDIVLQVWGGLFYLINKICFSLAEGSDEQRKKQLKIWGWVIYILGVPAWVTILILKHNWIAASIEAGGVPSMLFGLFCVYKNNKKINPMFDFVATVCTYSFMIFGVSYSLYDYHGIHSLSQLLEIGVMIGFLLGSYYLAKNKSIGWLFFMLMNASMGTLMIVQDKPILALQQVVSLCFVVYGFLSATRTGAAGGRMKWNRKEVV
ncbi:hypothetical protein [Desulfoluna sp.]|uniref:hypothetical protein n=1 Tax=Desulfoluna sp. TaxID=2045199 RepID=UPI002606CF95|nr:hypothetical protein [Desulfoluna sp.]